MSRSDVGSYTYGDPQHPHGVTAAGSFAFTYDKNGNTATRNNINQTWASFNLPTVLSAAALLAPAGQAALHTTVGLQKHVVFGAWFAAIAAGYAMARLSRVVGHCQSTKGL